jgi:hypothetical protein
MTRQNSRSPRYISVMMISTIVAGWPSISFPKTEKQYRNAEYRFQVTFPFRKLVCVAQSGGHPHGFYMRYGGRQTPCGATKVDPSASAISIYASGNTLFASSPEATLPDSCRSSSGDHGPRASERAKLSIPGHKFATCEANRPDGSIDIYVAAQASHWPPGFGQPSAKTPYINYLISLHSTPNRRSQDMVLFDKFLRSIVISPVQ